MTSLGYNYQNVLRQANVFRISLVKDRSCVTQICIRKISAKCILVVVVKWRRHANVRAQKWLEHKQSMAKHSFTRLRRRSRTGAGLGTSRLLVYYVLLFIQGVWRFMCYLYHAKDNRVSPSEACKKWSTALPALTNTRTWIETILSFALEQQPWQLVLFIQLSDGLCVCFFSQTLGYLFTWATGNAQGVHQLWSGTLGLRHAGTMWSTSLLCG